MQFGGVEGHCGCCLAPRYADNGIDLARFFILELGHIRLAILVYV